MCRTPQHIRSSDGDGLPLFVMIDDAIDSFTMTKKMPVLATKGKSVVVVVVATCMLGSMSFSCTTTESGPHQTLSGLLLRSCSTL